MRWMIWRAMPARPSPGALEGLSTAAFVPVAGGAAMEAPSRLFLRANAALAPLAFELPATLARGFFSTSSRTQIGSDYDSYSG